MITKYEPSFRINDKPDIMLNTIDFHYSLIGVPFIRVKVKSRYKLQTEVMKHRGKLLTPIANSSMRNLDIESNLKNQSNVSKRVLTKVEHRKSGDDQMYRISHAFEVSLPNSFDMEANQMIAVTEEILLMQILHLWR